MPPLGVHKVRVCKKCGETRDSEFYTWSRSECKRCACTRTSARTKGRSDLHRARHLRRVYGLTPEQYDTMFAQQQGLCALCGKPPIEGDLQKSLVIDHDHETGAIRGLIHGRCNSLLGYAQDTSSLLLAAAAYLSRCKNKAG